MEYYVTSQLFRASITWDPVALSCVTPWLAFFDQLYTRPLTFIAFQKIIYPSLILFSNSL